MSHRPHITSLPSEVIFKICSYLRVRHKVVSSIVETDYHSLLQLTTTCRTLHGPAIALLWHTLDDLVPVIYTLPRDLWVVDGPVTSILPRVVGRHDKPHCLRFTRNPVPDDFCRLQTYAPLVKSAWIEDCAYSRKLNSLIHPFALAALAHHAPKPLFRSLPALAFRDIQLPDRARADITALFFSSALTQVSLDVCDPERNLPTYLETLAAMSPQIEHLKLVVDWNIVMRLATKPRTALSGALQMFVNLRDLRVEAMDVRPAALARIGALPRLESLYLEASSPQFFIDEDNNDVEQQTTVGGFPALTKLDLCTDDLAVASAILEYIPTSILATLTIDTGIQTAGLPPSALHELFVTLETHPACNALRSLTLRCISVGAPCDISNAISPLLAARALTHFEMNGWRLPVVDNGALAQMAHAWPELERLHLVPAEKYELVTAPGWDSALALATVEGLVPLARGCPRLVSLIVPLNTFIPHTRSSSPPPPAALEERFFEGKWKRERSFEFGAVHPEQSVLTHLEVGYAYPEGQDEFIAGLLSGLFPRLRRVLRDTKDCDEERAWEEGTGWEEVNRLLGRFGLVRLQERSWAAAQI